MRLAFNLSAQLRECHLIFDLGRAAVERLDLQTGVPNRRECQNFAREVREWIVRSGSKSTFSFSAQSRHSAAFEGPCVVPTHSSGGAPPWTNRELFRGCGAGELMSDMRQIQTNHFVRKGNIRGPQGRLFPASR